MFARIKSANNRDGSKRITFKYARVNAKKEKFVKKFFVSGSDYGYTEVIRSLRKVNIVRLKINDHKILLELKFKVQRILLLEPWGPKSQREYKLYKPRLNSRKKVRAFLKF